jgi:hypothetical protein
MRLTEVFEFTENWLTNFRVRAFTIQNGGGLGKEWADISFPEMKGIKVHDHLKDEDGNSICRETRPLNWRDLFLEFDAMIGEKRREEDDCYRYLDNFYLLDNGYVYFDLNN